MARTKKEKVEETKAEVKETKVKERKKRGCKFCKAPFESLVKKETNVKLLNSEGRPVNPGKGKRFVCNITYCTVCDSIVRMGTIRKIDK